MSPGAAADVDAAVTLEVDDPVAVVTLRRPAKLNAFTGPMAARLQALVAEAVADPAVVGVVVTGEGRGFSAGLDSAALVEAASAGVAGRPREDDGPAGLFSSLLTQPKPIIAAVNGVAAGGGFVLACKCDLRIASTEASFTTVFSKRGLSAEHGLPWLLPPLVGSANALDLLWSSRRIDADEALRIGLVQRVVAPDELLPTCRAYVEQLAAEVSPASLADAKRLVYGHRGVAMREAFAENDRFTYDALERPDAGEGAAALVERRAPSFARVGGGAS